MGEWPQIRRAVQPPRKRHPASWICGWLFVIGAASWCGCGSATKTETPEQQPAEQRQPEAIVQRREIVNRPAIDPADSPRAAPRVKPGHQTVLGTLFRAHREDLQGSLTWRLQNSAGRTVAGTPGVGQLEQRRSVILPRGQEREFDLAVLTPLGLPVTLQGELTPTTRSVDSVRFSSPLETLPPQTYHVVILASDSLDYRQLADLHAIRFASHEIDIAVNTTHYVVTPLTHDPPDLPRSLLHWTSIAYLLWDDYDPTKLDTAQQAALVDWLHWGGQLIVSGPDSLATLAESFLAPYLPARPGTTISLDREAIAFLNRREWTVMGRRLEPLKPWSGIELLPHAAAERVLDSPLIVERRVGRGRTVTTAFRLDQRELRDWPGYDGFWHSALMRRPPRTFQFNEQDNELSVRWAVGENDDSSLTTDLRLLARDLNFTAAEVEPAARPVPAAEQTSVARSMAGWNASGPLATAAEQALVGATGIEVPQQSFVLRVLGLYLIVLVPVNWFLFRIWRRTEWAWLGVIVLALLFTGLVTHWAQINIGFARSYTEVAVVESYAGHGRGHIVRFAALYNSLGTAYKVQTAGLDSIAVPATPQNAPPTAALADLQIVQAPQPLGEPTTPGLQMSGVEVASNSFGLLHIEQMLDCGPIMARRCDEHQYEITNRSGRAIVGFVYRPGEFAWIGTLGDGDSTVCTFTAVPVSFTVADLPDSRVVHDIDLAPILNVLLHDRAVSHVRLLSWHADSLPGVLISPQAAQRRGATLRITHLEPPPYLPRTLDHNYRPTPKRASDDSPDK